MCSWLGWDKTWRGDRVRHMHVPRGRQGRVVALNPRDQLRLDWKCGCNRYPAVCVRVCVYVTAKAADGCAPLITGRPNLQLKVQLETRCKIRRNTFVGKQKLRVKYLKGNKLKLGVGLIAELTPALGRTRWWLNLSNSRLANCFAFYLVGFCKKIKEKF